MAALIALAAIGLLATGAIAGLVGVVSIAIRREERNLTLTGEETGAVTQVGRRLNGMYVRLRRGNWPAGRAGAGRPPAPCTRRSG